MQRKGGQEPAGYGMVRHETITRGCRGATLIVFILAFPATDTGQVNDYMRHSLLADSLLAAGKYDAAARSYSDAFRAFGGKGYVADRYNAAVAWSMAGVPDSAAYNLLRIVNRGGFADHEKMRADDRLRRVRRHPQWEYILQKARSNQDSIAAIEAKLDHALARKLDSLTRADQRSRFLLLRFRNGEIPRDSITLEPILAGMRRTDSLNSIETRRIFHKYGFPDYELAGRKGSGDFWLLVQHMDRHSGFQDSVLQAMKPFVDAGRASASNYAYLLDRVMVNTGRPQVYGTQMRMNKDSTSYEPQTVTDYEKLNDRRRSVGLGTIEDYIQSMNSMYRGSLKK